VRFFDEADADDVTGGTWKQWFEISDEPGKASWMPIRPL